MRQNFTLSLVVAMFFGIFAGLKSNAQTYTFTSAGVTGQTGPTQAQVNTAYSGTSLANSVTVTNGIQQWTVPVGGTYKIETYGAQGYGQWGGRGAYLSGEFTFQAGDKIKVLVGQTGTCCMAYNNEYGGGGGTFVVDENDSALIIAGGGGAAATMYNTTNYGTTYIAATDASTGTSGKQGQGTNSHAGGTNGNGGVGGGSATSGAGGGGGFYTNGTLATISGYSFLNGGEGGTGTSGHGGFGGGGGASSGSNMRAGGGGGYSGGGGAESSSSVPQYGGGGGSFNSGSNQNDSVGVGYGDGKVIITLMAPAVMVPNNAGTMGFADLPSSGCIGNQTIKVNVKNFGNNTIDSVRVTWEVDGVVQGTNWYQVNLDTLLSANDEITVTVGTYNFTSYGAQYKIRAWTSLPNNIADTVNSNDTSTTIFGTQLSGTFTVNGALATGGTNFKTFSDLTDVLNNNGVCGPLTVNVSPGTYAEQVKFGNIPGASATNTIRINGNGATVQFSGTSTANMHLLTFDGTKYVTIDSLTFKSLGTAYAWGALITNGSEYDSIIRCTFDLTSLTGTSNANGNGIVFSASPTSATTAGENGSNIYIGYSKVLGRTASGGPYYALMMYGASGQGQNSGNVIEHNVFSNFYYYGVYAYYCGDDNKFLYNDINRETKTSITTFYGTYIYYLGAGTQVVGNKIRNPYRAGASTTTTGYGLYVPYMQGTAANPCLVANNAVYGFNIQMTQGTYFYNSTYTKFYHNTIVNDITNTSTGTSQAAYVYLGNGSELKNNNIIVTGGSNSAKHGVYYASNINLSASTVSGNNIYVNSSNGTDNYAYLGGDFATQAAWQAANPTIEVGSPSFDPLFANASTGDLMPGNPLLLTSRLSDVTIDINGVSRNANTGIGAFEITPNGQNNAGMLAILGPDTAFCPGTKQIYAVIFNAGTNNINSLTINWNVNGTNQTPVSYTQTLVPMTATSGKNMDTVLLGSISISNTANSDIRVWTSNPNNSIDPVPSNDESRASFRAAMSGTYTVNSGVATGGTNFRSFTELANALSLGGVCGPVVVNVTPATYSEKVEFREIKGASFINTVRINGNGAIVRKTTASTSDLPILTLDGTKHLTIDSLTFNTSNASYGWGALITGGAQYDSIIRCVFDLSNMTASSSSYSNGIVFSASPTSPTTAGENGSDIYIGYCTIKGNPSNNYSLYYGFAMNGTNGQGHNANNVIEYNTIQDFYYYGARLYAPTNLTFRYNEISKKTKSTVTGITYGLYLYYLGEGTQIIGNRIHTLGGTLATPNTMTTYPIYCYYSQGTTTNPVLVANNAVYNTNKMTVSGAHLYYNNNLQFYHNTISIDVPVTSTTQQQGIYAYTSSSSYTGLDIKNNIISITEGNTGVKYGIYYSSPSYIGESEMNNIYVNSSQIGTQNYMYLNAAYATRAAYKASTYGSQYEINSPSENPRFMNLATGDLRPQNDTLIGTGEPLNAIVPIDINEIPRKNPPTPGAFREAPQGNNNAEMAAILSPDAAPCAGSQPLSVIIGNAGNNNITSLRINWSINGGTPQQTTYSSTLYPMGQGKSMDTVVLGSVNIAANTRVRVWTSLPNGVTDSKTSNDTIENIYNPAMGGVYTINKNAAASGTNYQSFASFISDLETYGVCDNVIANVVVGSGPYSEQMIFDGVIPGIAANKRVRINGNGQTVQFSGTSQTNMHLLVLDGAQHITIDSILFKTLGTTYGWGAMITNGSSFDSIMHCTFDLTSVTSTTSTYTNGITFSATMTSPTGSGNNGSNMYIGYNTVEGGPTGGPYYAFTMYGPSAGNNANNVVEYNKFNNFYYYGVYAYYPTNWKFRYNDINRKDKTSITTMYGTYIYYLQAGSEIVGNRIHNSSATMASTTSTAYGLYMPSIQSNVNNPILIANNAVYNIAQNLTYGIYATSPSYTNFYHNTIDNSYPNTSTGVNYGIYISSGSMNELKNNNVSITSGSAGDKYGIYLSTTTGVPSPQKNNVYVNSTNSGGNIAYYYGQDYNTLADLQNAYPGIEDNSPSVDPDFVNRATGDLRPQDPLFMGAGENLTALVPEDINGVARMLRSTIGAFEVPPVGNNNAGALFFTEPSGAYCPDSQVVKMVVTNAGINDINSLTANWTVNGAARPAVTYTGRLSSFNSLSGSLTDTITLGKIPFSRTTATNIVAWTSNPNGQNDPIKTNDTIRETFIAPTPITIALMEEICPGGDAILTLNPNSGYRDIKWQYSDNGTTWTDIANSNSVNISQPNVLDDRWYRANFENSNTCFSEPAQVIVAGVNMASVGNDTSCGPGTVMLTATPKRSNVNTKWYASQSSTTPLDTGTTFTTPFLNATTTYWVEADRSASATEEWVTYGSSLVHGSYTPFYCTYEGQQAQYLYLASELYAAGFSPGEMSSLSFDVGTVSNTYAFTDFTIKVGFTNSTALSSATWESNLTQVYYHSGYNPVAGKNKFNFSTPLTWDGVSNIVVEVCHQNNNWGGSVTNRYTNTSFTSVHYRYQDGQGANFCGGTTGTNGANSSRVDIEFAIALQCEGEREPVTAVIYPNPPAVDLGNDTVMCTPTFTHTLDAGNPRAGNVYQWSTGANTRQITVNTPGVYWVKVIDVDGCADLDTIVIQSGVVALPLTDSIDLCDKDATVLNAANAGGTYLWNTGATTQTINVTTGGLYTVRITSALGCVDYDTSYVNIMPLPAVDLGNDTMMCTHDSLNLNAGNVAGATYLWNIGAASNSIWASASGTYSVVVTGANGCHNYDTVVIVDAPMPAVSFGAVSALCDGLATTLDAGNPGSVYQWSVPGWTQQTLMVSTAGTYWVKVTNQFGCHTQDTTVVAFYPNPPKFSLGNDTSFCRGEFVTLRIGNTDTLATTTWNDNSTADTINAFNTGEYIGTVTNQFGCSVSDSVYIIVRNLPPSFNLGGDIGICDGSQTVLKVGNTDPNSSVLWNDNSIEDSLIVTTDGLYWATVTNQYGCIRSDSADVVVWDLPDGVVISSGNDTGICYGTILNLSTAHTDTTTSFVWSDNTTGRSINVSTPGTYFVTVYTTDGCIASDTIQVDVHPNPPDFLLGNDTAFCDGNILHLNSGNNDPNATVYWSNNTFGNAINVGDEGLYYAIVTNQFGCTASDSIYLDIWPLPVIDLGNDTSFCYGNKMTLKVPALPGDNFRWQDGSGSNTIVADKTGTYSVVVTSQYGCVDSGSVYIRVKPLPHTTGIVTAPAPNNAYQFIAQNATSVQRYLWSFGDGATATAASPIHAYANPGTYQASVRMTNECGDYWAYMTIEHHATGINDIPVDQKQLKLYPNPARDMVTLKNESAYQMETVVVYNMLGKVVYQGKAEGNKEYQLDVRGYASGMYNVKVILTNGASLVRKFEISR